MNTTQTEEQKKRINVLFCCGGGFSSSTMVAFFEKQSKEYQMQELIHFTFCPFFAFFQKIRGI
jgi:hypothetical protein